ncbi:MAG: glycosyltransferase family 4 protein [Chloroflexi bacterium]|nr:glycosyltransferase family 4 protein [Chloroflexota bacterium]
MEEPKRFTGVAVVAFPLAAKSIYVIARKLVEIFCHLAEKTVLISGNIPQSLDLSCATSVHDVGKTLMDLTRGRGLFRNAVKWAARNAWIQVLLSARLIRTRKDYQTAVFFLGTQYQLPILVSKLMGKKIICGSAGLGGDFARYNYGRLAAFVALVLVNFNYWLSDVILIESWLLASDKTLGRWERKLKLGTLYLADPQLFRRTTEVSQREPTIGFVGRFSPEKGVAKVVDAIPNLLQLAPSAKIHLIGSGPLLERLRQRIAEMDVGCAVAITGWVDHQELPDLLNQMRILVVPSESEGIPNVILEAFACGTAVAATPVGGIPDLIEDGKTGFLIADSTPGELARKLAEWLPDLPALEQITSRARVRLEENYRLASALQRYGRILAELTGI